MSIHLTNTEFDSRITPNKRKREELKERKPQRQLSFSANNKENHFVYNNFMEVKSISDLVKTNSNYSIGQKSENDGAFCNNAFEVIQKPPKKKNRKLVADECCFENPALNLNGPEHVLNPYEVKRAVVVAAAEPVQNCFENNGFNLRGEDRNAKNPFEIARDAPTMVPTNGIENPGLDVQSTPLAIGVPFTPTLGCRIDFKNVPIEVLTPSTLMNRQLVFSPIKKPTEVTPKRPNLSIISEEAVDISKELECYQSELENSMNEAKATKKHGNKNLMDIKRKNSFAKRLCEATEMGVDVDGPSPMPDEAPIVENELKIVELPEKCEEHSCHDSSGGHSDCPKSSTPKTPNENCIAKFPLERSVNENPDVVYEEIEESNANIENDLKVLEPTEGNVVKADPTDQTELFKNPAPFVRTYRRDVRKRPTVTINTETVNDKESKNDEKSKETKDNNDMFGGLRSSIRRSIQKLIHPHSSSNSNKNKDTVDSDEVLSEPKEPTPNILSTIRHSLRRKQPKQPLATSTPCESLNDISIIDTVPRSVFKDAALAPKLAEAKEDGAFRAKSNIRSSFRKSSRNVMKTVFKKNIEGYALEK